MKYTDGGTRTRTTLSGQRILSPLRLPFRHIGMCQQARSAREFCKRKNGEFRRRLDRNQTAGSFSSTGCVAGFGIGTARSALIPLDFKLPEPPF
jgi:hypothetical protein